MNEENAALWALYNLPLTREQRRAIKNEVFNAVDKLTKLPLLQQKVILEDILKPSERHAMTKQKLSRAEVVQQQLKVLQAELAHLARFPEDNFANGTVLQVVKTYRRPLLPDAMGPGTRVVWNPDSKNGYTEKQYMYVLLKADARWWATGQNGHQINGASWDKVIEFVDGDELIDVRTGLSVMTDSEDVAGTSEPEPSRGEKILGSFLNPQVKTQDS